METDLAARILKLNVDFRISIAESPDDFAELHRLRYDVFCSQRKILTGQNGTESDLYDATSSHVLLRRADGELIGTVRLVLPTRGSLDQSFPMQRVSDPVLLSGIPLATTGEISRFCLSRDRRDSAEHADTVLRLGLMKGIARASTEARLTHWCAVMEKGLLRLLHLAAIRFEPVGPPIEYFGTRQPAVANIADVLRRGKLEQRPIWNYVTDNDLSLPVTVVEPRLPGEHSIVRVDKTREETGGAASEPETPVAPISIAEFGSDLRILNPAVFERTAAFLEPQMVASHLRTLAERSEDLLSSIGAKGVAPAGTEVLAAASHTLAGGAGMFGFERLAAIAGRFENASKSDAKELAVLVGGLTATIRASVQEMRHRVPMTATQHQRDVSPA
jgi:N-acyl amino acid synthase of PEP-CTERM/exosortase system